ncbi:recombinase family protein [Chitinophaga barathri]
MPKKVVEENTNLSVWSYTRVSTKDQYDKNASVERQQEANKEYANLYKFHITEHFGGNHESEKSDWTRKEFSRLITKVETCRKKPFAIMVYMVSRFSRSGGSAIGLVNYLVEDLGVHLIETSSGISTVTERGKAAIYEELFQAFKENMVKKEWVIPSMIASLKEGNWMGKAPLGYKHYGRKVRDESRFAFKQRIEINEDGELLREAWQWKASGHFSDAQILSKLAARGLELTPQKISATWRMPFYAGILINSLLDEPVKGNWEPIVSEEDFIKVQNLLDGVHPGNHAGYTHNKMVEQRPLTRLLKCDGCKRYLVGYRNKKKNKDYYHCLHCAGVSLNAVTAAQRERKQGAHELFIDFLQKFQLPHGIAPLIKIQLTKLFKHYNNGQGRNDENLKTQCATLEDKIKKLKIRHGMGEIERETYELAHAHLSNQMQIINAEMNKQAPQLSNLEKLISQSLKKLENLSTIWASSDLEGKRIVHRILFPDGIYYNKEKREYLTTEVNSFLHLTNCLSVEYRGSKNANFQDNAENSRLVARTRIELVSKV